MRAQWFDGVPVVFSQLLPAGSVHVIPCTAGGVPTVYAYDTQAVKDWLAKGKAAG